MHRALEPKIPKIPDTCLVQFPQPDLEVIGRVHGVFERAHLGKYDNCRARTRPAWRPRAWTSSAHDPFLPLRPPRSFNLRHWHGNTVPARAGFQIMVAGIHPPHWVAELGRLIAVSYRVMRKFRPLVDISLTRPVKRRCAIAPATQLRGAGTGG